MEWLYCQGFWFSSFCLTLWKVWCRCRPPLPQTQALQNVFFQRLREKPYIHTDCDHNCMKTKILMMTCRDINGSEGLGERSCVHADCCLAGWVVHTNTHLVMTMTMMVAMMAMMMFLTSTILLSTMRESECHIPRLCSLTCSNYRCCHHRHCNHDFHHRDHDNYYDRHPRGHHCQMWSLSLTAPLCFESLPRRKPRLHHIHHYYLIVKQSWL